MVDMTPGLSGLTQPDLANGGSAADAPIDQAEAEAVIGGPWHPAKIIGFGGGNDATTDQAGQGGGDTTASSTSVPDDGKDFDLSAIAPLTQSLASSGIGGGGGAEGATTELTSFAGSGIVFNNTFEASVTAPFKANILAAEQQIARLWTNSITLNLDFKDVNQGNNGFLAFNNWPSFVDVSYATLRAALAEHASSVFAADAVVALPNVDPNPAGGNDWALPEAYARMLGLSTSTPTFDDTVTINTFYNWSNGQDVTNAVEHEISEGGMGRVGGLGDQNGVWSTMDLFRFNASGQPDYTDGRDNVTTYFSYTAGVPTSLFSGLSFNNQYSGNSHVNTGDTADFAQQDVFGTGSTGEINPLSATDIEIMDVLGWNPVLGLASDDFNGNGLSDIPLFNTNGTFVDWTMNGATIAAAQALTYQGNPVDLPSGWSVAGIGDFNGDGMTDMLLSNTNGAFVDWTMNGATIAAAQALTYQGNPVGLPSGWSVAGVGDFNGDRMADVLLSNTNGTFVDWTMNGSTITAAQALTYQGNPVGLPTGWSVAGVGDFNGDRMADILLRDTNGTFVDWTMNGSAITAAQVLTYQGNPVALPSSWSVAGVGDFNGDGMADILLSNTNGTFVDWTMNGSTITAAQLLAYQGNTVTLPAGWSTAEHPATGGVSGAMIGPGATQIVASGDTIASPTIAGGTLDLASGAGVSGPITFVAGSTGTLLDADGSTLGDTVMGFNEGSTYLSFAGETAATEAQVVAAAQSVNGNTVLTFPDHTSVVLVGVTHVDTGIFA